MAHHFKVETVPGTNKDGSPSKTKKIYRITDHTRRGRVLVGETTKKAEVEPMIEAARLEVIVAHAHAHNNDMHFARKHGLG